MCNFINRANFGYIWKICEVCDSMVRKLSIQEKCFNHRIQMNNTLESPGFPLIIKKLLKAKKGYTSLYIILDMYLRYQSTFGPTNHS